MIVTLTHDGWEVIFQQAHALLAAKLAGHWRVDERPQRWTEFLAAIAQHDDNQPPFLDRHHLTELGAPRGFTVSKGEREISDLEQPRRTVREMEFQGSYLALLGAMHARALYAPQGGEASDEMQAFLDDLESRCRRWRRRLGLRKAEAEAHYAIMRYCDRLSLELCQQRVPEAGRRVEVQTLPDGERGFLWRDGETLRLEPWPFEADRVEVDVEVRRLEQLEFSDDAELEEALDAADVEERVWRFVQGG